MNAVPPLSIIVLCVALVLVGGCSECPSGSCPAVATPSPVPTIEVQEFNEFVIFKDPVTKTAKVEYPVPLDLPDDLYEGVPGAYDPEINATAAYLQSTFFGERSKDMFDGYTVVRLQSYVTDGGRPLADILITGPDPADISIMRY